jgi:hypothetical protein
MSFWHILVTPVFAAQSPYSDRQTSLQSERYATYFFNSFDVNFTNFFPGLMGHRGASAQAALTARYRGRCVSLNGGSSTGSSFRIL